MKNFESLNEFINKKRIACIRDYYLKYQTYFKSGGLVKYYLSPESVEDLSDLVLFLRGNNIDYKIIGLTTNIILFDEITYSVIISTKNLTKLNVINSTIEVESGYSLQDLVRVCVINSFTGMEGLEGIPGSIGGALCMNAGAYGYAISDTLVSVKYMCRTGQVINLGKDECFFEYRDSIFKDNEDIVILSAVFKYKYGNERAIVRRIEMYHIARHSYQEFVYPNLGSMISFRGDIYKEIFKNNSIYLFIYMMAKIILKNPLSKFVFRKRPSNRIFNILLNKYIESIRMRLCISCKHHNFSDKSANILINNGRSTGVDYIAHVTDISRLAKAEGIVENEFVTSPVFDVVPEFASKLKELRKRKD